MSNIVVEISELYKEYNLGVTGHGTLYRDLQSAWAKFRGLDDPNSIIDGLRRTTQNKILAIQNINLKIEEGTILGIIGKNGAGKSTLLKIISRVTTPTKGSIKIKGKVSSLLEVGTGFHPELTGLENIYLNASMNGMHRKETNTKLDKIIEFSGVGDLINTPIKRYSTGMHVRLGFAVAAFLEPDILIVDEVLAVGDASFRKKAVNKMSELTTEGQNRTVLFVSHNFDSISELCNRVVVMDEGQIINEGNTDEMIDFYLNKEKEKANKYFGNREWPSINNSDNSLVELKSVSLRNSHNKIKSNFSVTEKIFVEVEYKILKSEKQLCLGLHFFNSRNVWLFYSPDDYFEKPWGKSEIKKTGNYRATFCIPENLLDVGTIKIDLGIFSPPGSPAGENTIIDEKEIIYFIVHESDELNSVRGSYPYPWGSPALRPKIKCVTKKV